MKTENVSKHIVSWLYEYCSAANMDGFVIGISGGVDSAVTSTLCALTGRPTLVVSMPIRQPEKELTRANNHIADLSSRFENVESITVDLTPSFTQFEGDLPDDVSSDHLSMANSRARLRMTTLYALAQAGNKLVCGTGNKVEDFGIGFYTKYGDGGVDISPIGDLLKTEVWAVAKEIQVIEEIINAKPTDGLWHDERSDEDQIGASYPELEWAMNYKGDGSILSDRQQEVLRIYSILNRANQHKMNPIPVCMIPEEIKY